MMTHTVSNRSTGRLCGLLYLVVVLTGMFSLAYVPSRLIVRDDASATFHNIASSELLFRTGIVSSFACYTAFLFLLVYLYKLLRPVNANYAKIMVVLAVVSVPISFINIQHKFAVLSLVTNPDYLKVFSTDQLQSQVSFYLHQYDKGILIVSVFWGLWLFPFGYLVYRSGFMPKILGIILMLGCFGYIINVTGHTFSSNYARLGISTYISLPASIGEISTCLWLLFVGAKNIKQPKEEYQVTGMP